MEKKKLTFSPEVLKKLSLAGKKGAAMRWKTAPAQQIYKDALEETEHES